MKPLIECVPNFSEGIDMDIIAEITAEIKSMEGIYLLNIDAGKAANRTVVTFAGGPEEIIEAAFRAIKKAAELIDMTTHKGTHPRIGATDVCPLIPLANISMEQVVKLAHRLAKRVGDELDIPVYCYEHAALDPKRRNLANCRSGQYEGLADKLKNAEWKPDYGPAKINLRSGATVIGGRDFLIAYNINLDSKSPHVANEIAMDVRQKGRMKRLGDFSFGNVTTDENDTLINVPGTLKAVKALGWYIEEYGIAQVSLNLTDISITPVHVAFEEVKRNAANRGIRVTGSELVGLIPLNSLLDAGKYFQKKHFNSATATESELIQIAVKYLGLDELRPFNPNEKILEYVLRDKGAESYQ